MALWEARFTQDASQAVCLCWSTGTVSLCESLCDASHVTTQRQLCKDAVHDTPSVNQASMRTQRPPIHVQTVHIFCLTCHMVSVPGVGPWGLEPWDSGGGGVTLYRRPSQPHTTMRNTVLSCCTQSVGRNQTSWPEDLRIFWGPTFSRREDSVAHGCCTSLEHQPVSGYHYQTKPRSRYHARTRDLCFRHRHT